MRVDREPIPRIAAREGAAAGAAARLLRPQKPCVPRCGPLSISAYCGPPRRDSRRGWAQDAWDPGWFDMTKTSIESASKAAASGRFRFRDLLRLAGHTLPYLKATWPDVRRV